MLLSLHCAHLELNRADAALKYVFLSLAELQHFLSLSLYQNAGAFSDVYLVAPLRGVSYLLASERST